MSDYSGAKMWLEAKPSQKVFLIEAQNHKDFGNAFLAIRKFCVFPIDGSLHERPVCVKIPGYESAFFPVSINGNLAAWEAGITGMCTATGRELALIESGIITFTSGRRIPVSETTVAELPA